MTFAPFLSASPVIQIHILFALVCLATGPLSVFGRITWRLHRGLGYVFATAIVGLALTGLFIPSSELALIGPFGPIHLLSVWVLWGIFNGIRLAGAGRLAEHRVEMKWIFFGAIGVPGLLTFMPGRVVNRMVFGEPSQLGFAVIAAGLLVLVLLWRLDRGATRRRLKFSS